MALELAAGPRTPSSRVRTLWDRFMDDLVHLRLSLPRGQSLPENVWRRRHHGILWMLWAHVVALFVFGLMQGVETLHVGAEVGLIALCAWAVRQEGLGTRWQSCIATSGVMFCSAIFTH